jgi:hypothetical protein
LLHDIRTLPNGWPAGDPPTSLADQFQTFVARSKQLSDEALQSMIDSDEDLTAGWKQRLTSLLPSVDPEQILARMRTDGAAWFAPDFGIDGVFAEGDPDDSFLDEATVDDTDEEITDLTEAESADDEDSDD